ncbi:MAG: peptidoglycan editing factor PgeF, partial [Desulfoprunum sp.]|nr:peptidoglycan editing factor PgeF [Desulfoprunum sp.]
MSDFFQRAKYQTFLADQPASCRFAMFDRHGGASDGLFTSFNTSYTVGDRDFAVTDNRKKVKDILNIDSLVSARQVHGDRIFCLEKRPDADCEIDGYDALVTDLLNVGIMIQHADCQAVLLFDPVRKVIGAVHCGWRGSVQNILGKTVKTMTEAYHSRPEDVLAVISPSLGPCCGEFINHHEELPADFQPFAVRGNHFDFWQISQAQLKVSGLSPSSITVTGICTSCSPDYFSYRRA